MVKKVMQTVTGLGGNCEGATIATLLGLNIEDIPSFWEGIDVKKPRPSDGTIYQFNLNDFLRQHGYKMLNLGVTKDPTEQDINWVIGVSKAIGARHLVAGISPRGHMHSVIYEDGKLWHDPHPEGGGVIPCQICLLVPLFNDPNIMLCEKCDYSVIYCKCSKERKHE
ncbi:MAG: hypothetical protein RR285_00175 [Acinetobacter sp.]